MENASVTPSLLADLSKSFRRIFIVKRCRSFVAHAFRLRLIIDWGFCDAGCCFFDVLLERERGSKKIKNIQLTAVWN